MMKRGCRLSFRDVHKAAADPFTAHSHTEIEKKNREREREKKASDSDRDNLWLCVTLCNFYDIKCNHIKPTTFTKHVKELNIQKHKTVTSYQNKNNLLKQPQPQQEKQSSRVYQYKIRQFLSTKVGKHLEDHYLSQVHRRILITANLRASLRTEL